MLVTIDGRPHAAEVLTKIMCTMSRNFLRGVRQRDCLTSTARHLLKSLANRRHPNMQRGLAALLFGLVLLSTALAQPAADNSASLSALVRDAEQRLGGKLISATPDKESEPSGAVYRLRLLQRNGKVMEVRGDVRDGSLRPVE